MDKTFDVMDNILRFTETTAQFYLLVRTGAGERAVAVTGSYPDRVFLGKLKNYYGGCFLPFHSFSKSQCF